MSELSVVLVAAIAAFLVSAGVTYILCQMGARFTTLDHPNERSLHTRPVPRGGGLAIVLATVLTSAIGSYFATLPSEFVILGAAGLVVAVISFIDDRRALSAGSRIATHILAAALTVYAGYRVPYDLLPGYTLVPAGPMSIAVTMLFVVWMTNLYNFMDGMDGLAGGMALFGFGGLSIFGVLAENVPFAFVNAIIAAAAGGFLLFNFPPARIFMGDVGAALLGFLAAAFTLWGGRDGVVPFWAALLLFSPFIVDATYTILRRGARRERIWEAHRTHIYQRLVQCGWGHRKTVLAEYVLMSTCLLTAVWATRHVLAVQQLVIAAWAITYAMLILAVARYERQMNEARSA
jgi:UDP-N-acetylmuramyl pentapeptide phosphotransferase/UDP-N-acetylglucosamine-1-phosphate transferase